ncbi:hypothetical protein C4564_01370 [Candidatus Microgenomates bacterium]|nr:MAG: hypothetical protein C4564_01370 [Candidatus Microgenomates bacterium]
MTGGRDWGEILQALIIATAFSVVALVFAYVVLSYSPTIAPVEDILGSPDPSVAGMHQLEAGKAVALVTTHGEQYLVTVTEGDGYHIFVKHPAHEPILRFTDSNSFEMSWTMHVGEIYLQRYQNSWWLWYPNGWSLGTQTE